MSVSLYPGIKRLHLFYSTRYDTIRTQDVRDDLLGIRVWYSTTQNFDYTTTTPIEFGVGSSISIDNLQPNVTYYVRYAFISRIDPTVFTVSSQLSAKTYDEFTSVYGELTNSTHYLDTISGTTTLDWQYATGTFRVWNISQEITGAGPVYSVVPNSATNGLQVTINATTGVFTATSWTGTASTAKVTFKAVYNGIEVFRDWTVVGAIGQNAPQIRLVMQPGNFVYKDATAILSSIPQVSVTANLTNLTGTAQFTVKAYRIDGTEITTPAITFNQVGNTITITNTSFHVANDIAYATVRAAIGTVYDQDTIYRLNNGTEQITVDLSNPVAQLQASSAGVVPAAEYADSGTVIEVYEGASKLFVDNSVPYANGTWTITNITATGIVAEDQPVYGTYSITFPEHANMTQDTATIDYTIQYKTSTGFVGTRVVRQSFAKSKEGQTGAQTAQVYVYARNNDKNTAPAFSASPTLTYNFTTGLLSAAISGWSQTIPNSSQGSVLWVRQATAVSDFGGSVSINALAWSQSTVLVSDGSPGDSIDIVFRRSATQPATPAASAGTPTDWYTDVNSVPAGSNPIWSSVGTKASGATTYTWDVPILIQGSNGADGLSIAELTIYKRSATALTTTPTGGSYNFANRTLTLPTDGGASWSATIPSGTDPIYTSRTVASVQGISGTASSLTWSAPVLSIKNGDPGTNGTNTAVVYAYKRSATAPVDNPGAVDYSFTTNTITTATLANSWQKTIPSGSDPLYVVAATAASNTSSDSIASGEWSSPTLLVQNGTNGIDGLNTATVYLYARNNSTTVAPTVNTANSSVYTFGTGVLSGNIPSGWTTTIPAESNGTTIWVIQATAIGNALTDTIANTEWSTPRVLGQKGDSGQPGAAAQTVFINGFTGFSVNTGGVFTPTTTSLTAVTTNITSPVYSWSITGGSLSSTTSATVTVTPNSGTTSISVTVSVTGSDMAVAKTATIIMPIAQQGGPGQGGANGIMSAFPSIYQWTSSSTAPSTAGLANSTYTWSTGSYTAPAGWSTTPPTNTSQGQYLWEVTVPLTVEATTSTSTLAWSAQTARAIAYTGTNGTNGVGTPGSATFLITRTANDSSAPTNAELTAAIGRGTPQAGDIATISYNSGNASIVYKYTTSWVQQSAYITGSLIVQNSISGDRITTNTLTADKIDARGLSIKDTAGNVILQAGASVSASTLNLPGTINNTPSGWQNSNISISTNGYLLGAGGGNVTLSGLGAGSLATKSSVNWNTDIINIPGFGGFAFIDTITQANISSYFAGSAIGTAYIADGNITNAKIGNILFSSNWDGTSDSGGNILTNGTTGWAISKSGSAIFNNVTARGNITADSVFATGSGLFEGSTTSQGYNASLIARGINRRGLVALTTGNYEAGIFAVTNAGGYAAQFFNTSTTGKGIVVNVSTGSEAIVAQGGLYGVYATATKAGGYAGYFSGSAGAGGIYTTGVYCAGDLTVTGSITGLTSGAVTTALGYTPYNSSNPAGYITGITSSMVTTALGYVPYNSSNPAGYITGITSGMVTSALGYTPGTSSFSGSYTDLSNKPIIPTATSQLTNDSGYITGITSGMVTGALGYIPGTSSFSGSYDDLSNKPTIPTTTSQLTNNSGFITGITSGMVTSALGYTPASGVGWVDNGGGFYLRTGSSGIALQNDTLIIQNGSVRPGTDANVYLGASYSRWEVVWAANGTIQTSDIRKKNILGTTPLGLEFINKLEPISYRYKVGGNTIIGYDEDNKPILQPRAGQRIFYGFKAQQVKQVVDSLGVEDFGGWVLDEKDDPNSGQSLRYTEFIAPLVKAVQELSAQVVALQAKVAELENK